VEKMQAWSDRSVDIRSERRSGRRPCRPRPGRRLLRLKASNHLGKYSRTGAPTACGRFTFDMNSHQGRMEHRGI
jgi:hypothetical protein